jgi:DNA-binding XRE family transcriptional regulator
VTPQQCRDVRDLLGLTRERLADMADLSEWTVTDFEAGRDVADCLADALEVTLLAAGVEFSEGASVRLRDDEGSAQ